MRRVPALLLVLPATLALFISDRGRMAEAQQASQVLVSNIDQQRLTLGLRFANGVAVQSFRTEASPEGYTVSGVDLKLANQIVRGVGRIIGSTLVCWLWMRTYRCSATRCGMTWRI